MLLRPTVLPAIFLSLVVPSLALHCLLLSPRHGLVAHKCRRNAVGCRIRVEQDSISWYDLSRRHDKHMACLLRGEFGSERRSGCVKKKSGTIRCWCYGQSNCNSPEKSRRLFEAFASGDAERFDREVNELDTEDPVDYEYDDAPRSTPKTTTRVIPTTPTTTTTMKQVKYEWTTRKPAIKTAKEDGRRAPSEGKLQPKATKAPIAIEIKTQGNDDLNSVEYLPAMTTNPPILPTTPSHKQEARALPTDPPNHVFDAYSLMEEAASAEYDIESETRDPDGHYRVNVVKIRSKTAEPTLMEMDSAHPTASCLVPVLAVAIHQILF